MTGLERVLRLTTLLLLLLCPYNRKNFLNFFAKEKNSFYHISFYHQLYSLWMRIIEVKRYWSKNKFQTQSSENRLASRLRMHKRVKVSPLLLL